MSPVVYVGKNGISEAVVNALEQALACHELVKVRFESSKDQVKPLCLELEKLTQSTLVATTGFTGVFFLPNPDPSERRVFAD